VTHLSAHVIERYCLGRLDGEATCVAEEHLLICEVCRDRVDATALLITALFDAAARNAPPMLVRTGA
jgi:predicted anti-sigma-YlaC factor YlaD